MIFAVNNIQDRIKRIAHALIRFTFAKAKQMNGVSEITQRIKRGVFFVAVFFVFRAVFFMRLYSSPIPKYATARSTIIS